MGNIGKSSAFSSNISTAKTCLQLYMKYKNQKEEPKNKNKKKVPDSFGWHSGKKVWEVCGCNL